MSLQYFLLFPMDESTVISKLKAHVWNSPSSQFPNIYRVRILVESPLFKLPKLLFDGVFSLYNGEFAAL